MKTGIKRLFVACFLGAVALPLAYGQGGLGWSLQCMDPEPPTDPYGDEYSDDFGAIILASWTNNIGGEQIDAPLMNVALGTNGSAIHNLCWEPDVNIRVAGSIGFFLGETGSIQSDRDNDLMITYGTPFEPGNSAGYAVLERGPATNREKVRFGADGLNMFFNGLSDRYILAEDTDGVTRTRLFIDLIGDAVRIEWQITNLTPTPLDVGLWFGQWIAMLPIEGGQFKGWVAASPDNFPYVFVPGQRPPIRETRWIRSGDAALFPEFVNWNWSQEEPYGMRVENGPSISTIDPETGESDATEADEFVLGTQGFVYAGVGLLGEVGDQQATMPDTIWPAVIQGPGIQQSDAPYLTNPAFIQKFYPESVIPGGRRTIVQYYRTTWGNSSYTAPYSVVADVPRLFNYDPNGLNGLTPNPAQVRVWIDNTRGFSSVEREVPLQNVSVTLDLTGATGVSFVGGGKQQTKVIGRVEPRRYAFVEFSIQVDDTAIGRLPYRVRVVAPPGPNKELVGVMEVSVTPKVEVELGANLLTMPWEFSDSAWASILQLQQPTEFQAFNWDPIQQGYVIATSAERGKGTWIVLKVPIPDPNELRPLSSNPTPPEDTEEGSDLLALQQGWNMIGNPYHYAIELGQLIGVARNDPRRTFTWKELVDGGFVNGGLAYWDEETDSYKFITDVESRLEPHRGYWVHVNDSGLTLRFPPVFLEGAITRSASRSTRAWTQTDKQWRLQLVARAGEELDDQNYLGIAPSTREARSLSIGEPPMSPTQKVAVSVAPPLGTGTRQAYAFSDKQGRQEWTVLVESKQAGPITLTWPNMGTVPKNVRFRLVDVATGASRDMRRTSGYTFEAQENTTRELKVQVEPGGVSRAVIGNVVVSQPNRGRDRNAPFTISYTLTGDATTTVRILGPGGREVYTATRGRADRAGENTVTWALRDNANRAVAPGTYRVEILAETADGERVRKVVPVNVIR